MPDAYPREIITYEANGPKEISYIHSGPREGQLLIFLHGWPGIAYTWKPQIDSFASLGFYVVAPDMPGYGQSTSTKTKEDYSHENIHLGLLALLQHTKRNEAVWIGHDWGAGVLSSFMSVYPEVIKASCLMAVPYRTLELGLEGVMPYINRERYPEKEFPFGQWDYQAFYEENFDKATEFFDADPEALLKFIMAGNPTPSSNAYEQLAFTSTIRKDGGWLGGIPKPLPEWRDISLEKSVMGQDVGEELIKAMVKTGWYAADSYYANHKANRAYVLKRQQHEGRFLKPLLFIEAQFDNICDTVTSRLGDPMRENADKLTWTSIASGHFVAAEAPLETNAAIARWLVSEVPEYWPYFVKNGHVKSYKK